MSKTDGQARPRLRRFPSSLPTINLGSAGRNLGSAGRYAILLGYCLIAITPIVLVAMNSLKTRSAIFEDPLGLPIGAQFSTVGYETVLFAGHFDRYLANSLIVTGLSVAIVVAFGSMAAFGLASYSIPGLRWIGLYLVVGILLPTRMGSVVTLQLITALGLVNNLLALVLVYVAQGLPVAVFIVTQFIREVPRDLTDAARVDGASEFSVYRLVLPLVRPALVAVAFLTMIPVWNDLWWPLILAPSPQTTTLTLGAQQFLGQYTSDWNAVLAVLSMAMAPALIMYAFLSRYLIKGVMAGAVK